MAASDPIEKQPMAITTSKPDPDPTVLTTAQVIRENSWLRELMESRINSHAAEIALIRENLSKVPGMRNEAIEHLESLHDQKFAGLSNFTDERFRSIATQFAERDTRVEQTAKDSKVAVDAALSAAKEAVTEQNKSTALAISKSDAAFFKQLDQLVTLLDTKTNSLTKEVDELRSIIRTLETRDAAGKEAAAEARVVAAAMTAEARARIDSGRAWLFGGIAAVAAVISILFTLFSRMPAA